MARRPVAGDRPATVEHVTSEPLRRGRLAIAVMAEATARTLRADGIAAVPIQPPPQYVIALAWRRDEQATAAHRFLDYLRRYRDRHESITGPQVAPPHTTVTQALTSPAS